MAGRIVADFRKTFPDGPVVSAKLSMPARTSHVLVLFGPSGAGKTTILRCIAGLEAPESGSIRYEEKQWFDSESGLNLAPQGRRTGYVSQKYTLFPHLNVLKNIGYGLRADTAQKSKQIADLLSLFRITDLRNRLPAGLSGGQQQRVALARALASDPALLLLDEPFSAVDTKIRMELRSDIRNVLKTRSIPAIFVTHDWTEALTMADEISILSDGRILQTGTPEEVFSRPVSHEAAEIAGIETVVIGRAAEQSQGLLTLKVGSAHLTALRPDVPSTVYYVCVRAENVVLQNSPLPKSSMRNQLQAQVREIRSVGPLCHVILDCGFELTALLTAQAVEDLELRPEAITIVGIKAAAIHLIPRY